MVLQPSSTSRVIQSDVVTDVMLRREQHAYEKKVRKAKAKRNAELAAALAQRRPTYTLDRLVKERWVALVLACALEASNDCWAAQSGEVRGQERREGRGRGGDAQVPLLHGRIARSGRPPDADAPVRGAAGGGGPRHPHCPGELRPPLCTLHHSTRWR